MGLYTSKTPQTTIRSEIDQISIVIYIELVLCEKRVVYFAKDDWTRVELRAGYLSYALVQNLK